MSIQVVQEKFPFVDRPAARLVAIAIKRGRKRSNEVELAPEIGQRLERADSPGKPIDSEERDQFIGKRMVTDIEADAGMTKLFRQKKKETGAASKIENLFRLSDVEFQFLHARQIDREPMLNVGVFRVANIGARVALLNIAQPRDVDLGQKRIHFGVPRKFHPANLG
jgi:hypothetical protein